MFLHFKNTGKNIIFKLSNDIPKKSSLIKLDFWRQYDPNPYLWYSFNLNEKEEETYRRFSTKSDSKSVIVFSSKNRVYSKNHMDITKRLWLKRRVIISLKNRIVIQISCDIKRSMLAISRIRKIK